MTLSVRIASDDEPITTPISIFLVRWRLPISGGLSGDGADALSLAGLMMARFPRLAGGITAI
jgi:hypothetical protein